MSSSIINGEFLYTLLPYDNYPYIYYTITISQLFSWGVLPIEIQEMTMTGIGKAL
jgi:hypothetical protein